MFNRLKESAKITEHDPTFKARYIGCTETFVASGKGCTNLPVQKLWDNSADERYLKRVQIKIRTDGIHMLYLDDKKEPERLYKIENISFCNVESVVNDKIFSWICKDTEDSPILCYAVLCSKTETARAMALVLSRAFQIAYKDWKANKNKLIREVEKTERNASMAKQSIDRKGSNVDKSTMDNMSDTNSSCGSTSGLYTVNSEGAESSSGRSDGTQTMDESPSREIGIQAEL